MLAVIVAIVDEIDGEWIVEGFPSLLEAHAVLGEIGCGLCIDLRALGAEVVHVQWSPPAGGNARLAGLLDKLRSQ